MNWPLSAIDIIWGLFDWARATESRTGVKQFVAGPQLIIQKISQDFDPGNALESGVAQYPEVGVEFVGGFG